MAVLKVSHPQRPHLRESSFAGEGQGDAGRNRGSYRRLEASGVPLAGTARDTHSLLPTPGGSGGDFGSLDASTCKPNDAGRSARRESSSDPDGIATPMRFALEGGP